MDLEDSIGALYSHFNALTHPKTLNNPSPYIPKPRTRNQLRANTRDGALAKVGALASLSQQPEPLKAEVLKL